MKINDWCLVEIKRSSITRSVIAGNFNDDEKLITKVFPFGTPNQDSVKQIVLGKTLYFSCLSFDGNQGEGRGLVIAMDPMTMKENLMAHVTSMLEILRNPPPTPEPLTLNYHPPSFKPIMEKDFDVAVFSFLARLKTIILGEANDISDLLSTIIEVTLAEMRLGLSFVTHSTTLNENVNIIGMPMNDEIFTLLDETKGELTICVLGDRVYGNYSSTTCKKIANLAKKGKFDEIKATLQEFYEVVKASSELMSPLEFAEKHDLTLSDAQLALIMRAKLHQQPIPRGILEEILS